MSAVRPTVSPSQRLTGSREQRRGFRLNTSIRKATAQDIPRLVELHCRAFNASTNHLLLLGRAFMERYFAWYCSSNESFLLLAEGESGIAGYVAVNQGSYYRALKANWIHVLLGFAAHPGMVFHSMFRRRLRELMHAGAKPTESPDHRACMAYLALDPAMNVRGVGPTLMRAAFSESKKRGWHELTASIHPENRRAEALTVMVGFVRFPDLDSGGLVGYRIKLGPDVTGS